MRACELITTKNLWDHIIKDVESHHDQAWYNCFTKFVVYSHMYLIKTMIWQTTSPTYIKITVVYCTSIYNHNTLRNHSKFYNWRKQIVHMGEVRFSLHLNSNLNLCMKIIIVFSSNHNKLQKMGQYLGSFCCFQWHMCRKDVEQFTSVKF